MDENVFLNITALDIERYETVNVSLSRPRIIGLYEYNRGRLVPAKSLNYLKDLKLTDYPLDLNNSQEHLMFVESHHRQTVIHLPLEYAMSQMVEPFATNNDGVELTHVYASRRNDFLKKNIFKAAEKKLDDLEALNELRFVLTKQMNAKKAGKEWNLLKYWLQTKLVNVDDIYLAYKNSNGIVATPPEHLVVSTIPNKCHSWKPEICVGILHEFLEKIEELMANVNSVDTVYTIHFNGKRQKCYYYSVHEGQTNKSFIPIYYPNFVAKET